MYMYEVARSAAPDSRGALLGTEEAEPTRPHPPKPPFISSNK